MSEEASLFINQEHEQNVRNKGFENMSEIAWKLMCGVSYNWVTDTFFYCYTAMLENHNENHCCPKAELDNCLDILHLNNGSTCWTLLLEVD